VRVGVAVRHVSFGTMAEHLSLGLIALYWRQQSKR